MLIKQLEDKFSALLLQQEVNLKYFFTIIVYCAYYHTDDIIREVKEQRICLEFRQFEIEEIKDICQLAAYAALIESLEIWVQTANANIEFSLYKKKSHMNDICIEGTKKTTSKTLEFLAAKAAFSNRCYPEPQGSAKGPHGFREDK